MVRTRKAIYVGNKEVQRRYIGNKLVFVNLDDMNDRVEVSGTEIFTDKADNSVVHVEVDGESYQDGVPTPDYPIEIHSLSDFDVVSSTDKLTEGQLEGYDYDIVYEDVYKINLSLSEPLRSVGDVKDRLFRDSDGLWKIERNVWETVVDGSESWTRIRVNETTLSFSTRIPVAPKVTGGVVNYMSDKFEPLSNNRWAHDVTGFFFMNNGELRINILKSNMSGESATNFSQWLSVNPVTIQYELLTPSISTLDQELQDKLNNLRSFQDSNYVYTIINAENLKPTLHATFKSKGWYDYYLKTLLK